MLRALAIGGALATLIACSSSSSNEPTTAPPPADPPAAAPPPPGYPAITPSMPIAKSSGGPVLATPKIVPVFFGGDDDQEAVTTFLRALPASSYWKEITKEYGIGATTIADPIVLATETAPTTITDPQVKTWLGTHLGGATPDWGAPDPTAIYVVFYPSSTSFSIEGAVSCQNIGAYHSMATIAKTDVTYAIVGRCPKLAGLAGIDFVTAGTSHELIEAATDPSPVTSAFAIVDDAHIAWEVTPGAEVADLCDSFSGAYFKPADLPFTVERVWSNARAAAGHHPCIPAIPDEIFFNAMPAFDEDVDMTPGPGPTKGIAVPIGTTKTVDVALFSDGPTSGPWTVTAKTYMESKSSLDLSLDRATGQNGDTLKLTIKRTADGPLSGGSVVVITSTLGPKKNVWVGYVSG